VRLSREQLLDAAEEVFARKGFHATTLREISERAEFSVGSVYSFFSSKEELFTEIFHRRGAEFVPGMREILSSSQSPRDQLHALADFEIEFFRRYPDFGRLFLRETGTSKLRLDPQDDAGRERFAEAMHLESDLFKRGQDCGELRGGDPDVLAELFSGLISAYQSRDPVVADGAAAGTERMPLQELHAILDDAFVTSRTP
jgi:AcrR family transcriptional regulator